MTEQQEPQTEQCPVCGQDYEHYRKEDPHERTVLRDDATECRVKDEMVEGLSKNHSYKVYVHV